MFSREAAPGRNLALTILVMAIGGTAFAFILRSGQMKTFMLHVHQLGAVGVIIGVLLQAVINIAPLPGEFTSVMLMELYGALWGGVLSYIGGVLGAVGAYYVARSLAAPFQKRLSSNFLYGKVEAFISRGNFASLLLARVLPLLPYHLLNYMCGLLKARLSTFLWTAAIGLIPFHVAMSLLYSGVKKTSITGIVLAASLFLLLGVIGWYVGKRNKRIEALR